LSCSLRLLHLSTCLLGFDKDKLIGTDKESYGNASNDNGCNKLIGWFFSHLDLLLPISGKHLSKIMTTHFLTDLKLKVENQVILLTAS
jgi:hypothetical protein